MDGRTERSQEHAVSAEPELGLGRCDMGRMRRKEKRREVENEV